MTVSTHLSLPPGASLVIALIGSLGLGCVRPDAPIRTDDDPRLEQERSRPAPPTPEETAPERGDEEEIKIVRGRVTDQDGRPVADREVWALERAIGWMIRASPCYLVDGDERAVLARARTGLDGSFRLECPPERRVWVGVAPIASPSDASESSGRGDVAPIATRFTLAEGERETAVELVTHRGLSIRGRVLLPEGSPASGCTVEAKLDAWLPVAKVRTDAVGAFTIDALAPGELSLQASREGLLAPCDPAIVSVGAGDVILRLKPAGAIAGSVVDLVTRQAVPATLYLTSRGSQPGCRQLGLPVDRFDLDRLEPGTYDLVAVAEGGRVGAQRGIVVRSEQRIDGVTIEVDPGARLTLKYEGSRDSETFELRSEEACLGWVTLVREGSVELHVPPGMVRASPMSAGSAGSADSEGDRSVLAVSGQEQTLVLE